MDSAREKKLTLVIKASMEFHDSGNRLYLSLNVMIPAKESFMISTSEEGIVEESGLEEIMVFMEGGVKAALGTGRLVPAGAVAVGRFASG